MSRSAWLVALLTVAVCPSSASAQGSFWRGVEIRVGAFMPISEARLPEESFEGTSSLSLAPMMGVFALGEREPWSLRVGADVMIPKAQPTFTGSQCDAFRGTHGFGDDCTYDRADRGIVLLGQLVGLRHFGPWFGSFGIGARVVSLPDGACETIHLGCFAAYQAADRNGLWAAGILGVGTERPWGTRKIIVELADIISRFDGRIEHELTVTVGLVPGRD